MSPDVCRRYEDADEDMMSVAMLVGGMAGSSLPTL